MIKTCNVLDDERTIKAIIVDVDDLTGWIVGQYNVTKIVAYGEPGQGAYVPYFAVYKDECLTVRVNGKDICSVHYDQPLVGKTPKEKDEMADLINWQDVEESDPDAGQPVLAYSQMDGMGLAMRSTFHPYKWYWMYKRIDGSAWCKSITHWAKITIPMTQDAIICSVEFKHSGEDD